MKALLLFFAAAFLGIAEERKPSFGYIFHDFQSIQKYQCASTTLYVSGATIGDGVIVGNYLRPEILAYGGVVALNRVKLMVCNFQETELDLKPGLFWVVVFPRP